MLPTKELPRVFLQADMNTSMQNAIERLCKFIKYNDVTNISSKFMSVFYNLTNTVHDKNWKRSMDYE